VGLQSHEFTNGYGFMNITKMVDMSLHEHSVMGLYNGKKRPVLHLHWDGFLNYFMIDYSFAHAKKLVYTTAIINSKEEEGSDVIIEYGNKFVEIGNQNIKTPMNDVLNNTSFVEKKPIVLAVVDWKAENLVFKKDHILLYVRCDGRSRYACAIPLKNNNDIDKYRSYCDLKIKPLDHPISLDLKQLEEKLPDYHFEKNEIMAAIVKCNNIYFPTNFSAVFSSCPFDCNSGSCYHPFYEEWSLKIPKNRPDLRGMKEFIGIIMLGEKTLGKQFLKKLESIIHDEELLKKIGLNNTKIQLKNNLDKSSSIERKKINILFCFLHSYYLFFFFF
jgi:hypothetical protein